MFIKVTVKHSRVATEVIRRSSQPHQRNPTEEYWDLLNIMASRLAKIEFPKHWGPFDLLKDWLEDFKTHTKASFVPLNIATASRSGEVKNRIIALQKIVEDGIIFNTNLNSPKVQQMNENPQVAASFLLMYSRNNTQFISRQVRIEGVAEQLPQEMSDALYNLEPFYAKMRTLLIPKQSVPVEWDELNKKHNELLERVTNGELELKPSSNLVAYKIVPKSFDFYHAFENEIADRILFKIDSKIWTHSHITA